MIALLDAELRRAFARRITRFTALLALLGITTAGVIVFLRSADRPPEQNIIRPPDFVIEECVANPHEFGVDPRLPDQELREACLNTFAGYAFYVQDPRFHLRDLQNTFEGLLVPLGILVWLLGASLVGAEWRAGTMTTLLTWEPRRIQVMVAKALAALVVGVVFFVGVQVLTGLALLPSALFRGTTDGFALGAAAEFLARGTLLAGVATLIGFALGSIGRNTTMAMAAGFIYIAILEGGVINAFFPGVRRWLIVGNSAVLVAGENSFIPGRSPFGAGVLLAAYAVGAVAVAAALFRARDVT